MKGLKWSKFFKNMMCIATSPAIGIMLSLRLGLLCFVRLDKTNASVVKLVDTPDSKSGSFTGVAVQVRPLVPLVSNIPSLNKRKCLL